MVVDTSQNIASYAPAQTQQPVSNIQRYLVLKHIKENQDPNFRYILEDIGINPRHLNFILDYFKRNELIQSSSGTQHRLTEQGISLYNILQSHFEPFEHKPPISTINKQLRQSVLPEIDPDRKYTFADVMSVLDMNSEEVRKATESGELQTTPVYRGDLNMYAEYPGTSLVHYRESKKQSNQGQVQEEIDTSPKKSTDRQTRSIDDAAKSQQVKPPDNNVLAFSKSWPVALKSCPRCQGDLYYRTDEYGSYKGCLPCGYTDNGVAQILRADSSRLIGGSDMDFAHDPQDMPPLDEYVAIMRGMKDKERSASISQLEGETGILGETIMRHLKVLIGIGYVTVNGKSTNQKRSERYGLRPDGINFFDEYESKTDEIEQLAKLKGLEGKIEIILVQDGELTDIARNLSNMSTIISDSFDSIIQASSDYSNGTGAPNNSHESYTEPSEVDREDNNLSGRRKRSAWTVNSIIEANERSDKRWYERNKDIVKYLKEGKSVMEIVDLTGRGQRSIWTIRDRLNDIRAAQGSIDTRI